MFPNFEESGLLDEHPVISAAHTLLFATSIYSRFAPCVGCTGPSIEAG